MINLVLLTFNSDKNFTSGNFVIFLTLKDAKVHVIILPCTVIKKNLKLSAGTVLYMSALPVIIKNVSYKI